MIFHQYWYTAMVRGPSPGAFDLSISKMLLWAFLKVNFYPIPSHSLPIPSIESYTNLQSEWGGYIRIDFQINQVGHLPLDVQTSLFSLVQWLSRGITLNFFHHLQVLFLIVDSILCLTKAIMKWNVPNPFWKWNLIKIACCDKNSWSRLNHRRCSSWWRH